MLDISPSYRTRKFGRVNWIGVRTLYMREVMRFAKVHVQTVTAPLVTTLLYLAIFMVAMGGGQSASIGAFLAPGLIMMAITQNAFANTSSSIMIAKVQGNIVDILMPPLNAAEVVVAIVAGGVTRGILVGAAVGLAMVPFVHIHIADWGLVLFHALAGAMLLASVGLIGGLWAEKFDQIAAVTNFVVIPLTFLSGTFYKIDRLSEPFRTIARFDPLFYLIDGFRAGFLGIAEAPALLGIAILAGLNIALFWLAWYLFHTGYRIRS